MENTIQLYSDREKKNKVYPITSPDRVIDENGVNIKEQLDTKANKSDLNIANSNITNLESSKATRTEVEVERKRIDSFTKLTQGSTTGDAELIDGRIGADGVTYTNIGEAIRGQIGECNELILDKSPFLYWNTLLNAIFEISIIGVDSTKSYYIESVYSAHTISARHLRIKDNEGNVVISYDKGNSGNNINLTVENINYTSNGITLKATVDWTKIPLNNTTFTIDKTQIKTKFINPKIVEIDETTTYKAVSPSYINIDTSTKNVVIPKTFTIYKSKELVYKQNEQESFSYSTYASDKFYIAFNTISKLIEIISPELKEPHHFLIGFCWGGLKGSVESFCGVEIRHNGYSIQEIEISIPNYTIQSKWKDKNVLILGDSISDNSYESYDKWNKFWEASTGAICTHNGIHATGFVSDKTYLTDGSKSLVNRISALDTSIEYDLIIIFLGTNDYGSDVDLGTMDSNDKTKFIPSVDYCLKYIRDTWVNSKVACLLPLQRYNGNNKNGVGYSLQQYNNALEERCNFYSIPTLDLYNKGNFIPQLTNFRNTHTFITGTHPETGLPNGDGLHPNLTFGRDYLMTIIAEFLELI